jgi:hypothetical protein
MKFPYIHLVGTFVSAEIVAAFIESKSREAARIDPFASVADASEARIVPVINSITEPLLSAIFG